MQHVRDLLDREIETLATRTSTVISAITRFFKAEAAIYIEPVGHHQRGPERADPRVGFVSFIGSSMAGSLRPLSTAVPTSAR
jgi:hypothetical protein